MIILDSTDKSLEVLLDSAVSANEAVFTSNYVDISQTDFGVDAVSSSDGQTNGTTAVTIISAPSADTSRQVKYLSIYNDDTDSMDVEVRINNNGTFRSLVNVTLSAGKTLQYTNDTGWQTADVNSLSVIESTLAGATDKDPLVDTDNLNGVDNSGSLIKNTWANIKSALASATQTLTNKTITDRTNEIHAEEVYAEVRNASGSQISQGDVVYVSGYNSGQDLVEVDLADADDASKMPALGVASEDISNNSTGKVDIVGIQEGIDTSSHSVGDKLYVSTTPGEFTGTAPTSDSSHVQLIGTVIRSNASTGAIEVQIEPEPLKIVPTVDSDAVSKKHADTKANLSDGNDFAGLQEFQDGISFDGGVNVLGDYEKLNSYTVEYTASSGSFDTITYNSQIGRYALLGNICVVIIDISTNDVVLGTASGNLSVNLPFVAHSSANQGLTVSRMIRFDFTSDPSHANVLISPGTSTFLIDPNSPNTTSPSVMSPGDLTTGANSTYNILRVSGAYIIN